MAKAADTIKFDQKGVGSVLHHNRLAVPLNQREYAWEADHVSDLLQDSPMP